MNADGKIYIIVTDKLPGGVGPGPGPSPAPSPKDDKNKKDDQDLFGHWARTQILSTVKRAANAAVSFSISNIGNLTGNYLGQTQVQESIALVHSMMGIGTTAAAGFAVGGVPGAILGASLAVINQGISISQSLVSQNIQQRKANRELEQLRERAGMNQYIDWSRGTEN